MGRVMLCLAALALLPVAVQAQVYKCVDAAGKVVYEQLPCPKGARSTALSRSAPAAPAQDAAKGVPAQDAGKADAAKGPPAQKSPAQLDEEFRKRRQQQADADKKNAEKQAQAQDKQENCKAARLQLANLESGTRQMRVNENGERYFLDDGQIEQEKARARRIAESSCGS